MLRLGERHKCCVRLRCHDSVIGWRCVLQSEERLTDGCDNSSGKEEGGADIPQAGLIERVPRRVHAGSDGGNHLLQRGGQIRLARGTEHQGASV